MHVCTTQECHNEWLRMLKEYNGCAVLALYHAVAAALILEDEVLLEVEHGEKRPRHMDALDIGLNILCYALHGETLFEHAQRN